MCWMLNREVREDTYQHCLALTRETGWAYWIAAVVLLQACVLVLQEFIGPSFFLPAKVSRYLFELSIN